MATLARNTKIVPGVTYTNAIGMTATLRFDAEGGYVPGLGPQGVWYVEQWAPYFPTTAPFPFDHNRDRRRPERAMRNWLKQTEFPPPVN